MLHQPLVVLHRNCCFAGRTLALSTLPGTSNRTSTLTVGTYVTLNRACHLAINATQRRPRLCGTFAAADAPTVLALARHVSKVVLIGGSPSVPLPQNVVPMHFLTPTCFTAS